MYCSIVDAREREYMYRHLPPSRNSKKNSALFHLNRVVQTHKTSFPCCLRLMMWPLSAQGNTKDKGKEKNINLAEQFILSRLMMCPRGEKDKGKGKRRNKNNLAELFLLSRLMMWPLRTLAQHKFSKVKSHSILFRKHINPLFYKPDTTQTLKSQVP